MREASRIQILSSNPNSTTEHRILGKANANRIHDSEQQLYEQNFHQEKMPLLSRGRKQRIHLSRAKLRICRRRKRGFIEVYPPTPVALAQRSPSLPESRPRKSRLWEGDPGSSAGDPGTESSGRRSSGFNHRRSAAFCDATASLRGSRAERPSSRASQAAGGRLHGATWPREDRRVYLDHAYWLSRYSAAQPERSGSLIQVVCLSSQRN